jgi:hypothetical protein
MSFPPCRKFVCTVVLSLGILLNANWACRGEPDCWMPTCLEDLENLSACQLYELYTHAELGRPFIGVGRGRLVYLADRTLPRAKLFGARQVWRGKMAYEDGAFVNRWIGGYNAIGSEWVIGPSWIDGRPAVVMEYPPGTKLFWNMHDELREIAPGLYMGPVFERFPCPKFRGYVAIELECCKKKRWCRR